MCCQRKMTNLGFTTDDVVVGTHMCLVYTSEDERKDTLLKYLLSGFSSGERMACFSDKITEEDVRFFCQENNISYDERKKEGSVSLSGTGEVYFEGNRFDPDRMIKTLTAFYDSSINMDFPACRVIGEMIPEISQVPGGDRLLEYECRVTQLTRTHPVTSVCQYDANAFDGGTIMEVLKVHPKMIVNGVVVNNPFFVEPEIYLAQRK